MANWQKLGIIAGGGALPVRIAASCSERGDDYFIIRLTGFYDAALANLSGVDCAIGEAGRMLRELKAQNCDAVVLAGIVARPDFASPNIARMKLDMRGAALLAKVVAASTKGDGALLNVLVEMFESEGLLVVGADDVVQGLIAPVGALGKHKPSKEDFDDIRKAAALIDALGPFDMGQGAVVANGLVVAVEAAEGTDAMLSRCAALLGSKKANAPIGVLVKRPKPGQELRIDLPTIGPETVRRTHTAGLRGIAVESGLALVIDSEELVRLADRDNIFVYGFSASEV